MHSTHNCLQSVARATAAVILLLVFCSMLPYRASSDQRDVLTAQLAARSESLRLEDPASLEVSALLAIESLKVQPSAEGDHALRSILSLLRPPFKTVQHDKPIDAVAISHDGIWVGTASDNNTARIGNTSTRETFTIGHPHQVTNIIFSPNGKLAATASQGMVKLFDTERKTELEPPLTLKASGRTSSLVFSEDDRLLAVGTNNSAEVFSMDTKKEIAEISFKKGLRSVGLDGVRKHLIAADGDAVRIIDLAHNNQEVRVLKHGAVHKIALDRSRGFLATASADGAARLVNLNTGAEVLLKHPDGDPSMPLAPDPLTALNFSSDGKLLATGSQSGVVRVYRVTGECKEVSHFSHRGGITAVAFLSSNKVVSASADRTASIFSASTGREIARLVHPGSVTGLSVDENSATVVTASGNLARLFRITRAVDIDSLEKQNEVGLVAFSHNGRLAISTMDAINLFDSANGHRIPNDLKFDYPINRLALSADGRFTAVAKLFGSTHITQILDGKNAPRTIVNSYLDQKAVTALAFSADNQQLVVAASSTNAEPPGPTQAYLLRFNPLDGKQIGAVRTCGGKSQSAASSNDHLFTAIGTSERACVFYQGPSQRQFEPLKVKKSATAIAFSTDDHFVAIGTEDGYIYAYALSGKFAFSDNPVFVSEKHETAITAVMFAEDSHTLSSQTAGGILRLFDLNKIKNTNMAILRFPSEVKASAFMQNTLVTLSVDEDGAFIQRHLLASKDLITQGCSVMTGNLSKDERKVYLGQATYDDTCAGASLPGW
jgi:WD40 repeat protein